MQLKTVLTHLGSFVKNIGKQIGLFFRFLFTKTFLLHLSIAIGIVVIIFIGISYFLKDYTNHGESFAVPDFRGMKLNEVKTLAREKNLEVEVIDSVYNFTGRKGTVVDQTPPPGFNVKKGRTIFLTRQKYQRAQVEVPGFTDLSKSQARADIQSLGLKINHIRYKESRFHDLVLAQLYKGDTLKAGTKLPKGTGITLVVGKESNAKSQVPSLIGLTTELANSKALDFSLNLGQVHYDHTVKTKLDTVNAKVWRQKPKAGSGRVSMGTAIDVHATLSENKLNVAKVSQEIEE